MKNFKLLLIGLSFLTFISCSKDEGLNQQQIQGEWILTDAAMITKTTIATQNGETILDQDGSYNSSDLTLLFDADNSYVSSGNLILDVDNFMNGDLISSETIDYSELGVGLNGKGIWTIVNEKLILDNDAQLNVSVDNDMIVVRVQEFLEISADMTIDLDMELTFSKQ